LTVSWRLGNGAILRLTANLSADEIAHTSTDTTGTPIWGRRGRRPTPALVGVLASGRALIASGRSDRKPTACNSRRISISTPPAAIVPYLKALGITHLYASPFMKSRKGSSHGYDVVDHTKLNPDLGGEAGFERLSRALKQHESRAYSRFSFPTMSACISPTIHGGSMCWNGVRPHRTRYRSISIGSCCRSGPGGGVLLPIIGSSYGEALEKGEIELRYDAGEGSFLGLVFRTPACRSRPERYSEILRSIVKQAGADDDPVGKAPARAGVALPGIAPSQSQGSARLQGGAKRYPPLRQTLSRARASMPIVPGRIARSRPWCCIVCWNASTTGSGIGDWLPATSTIGVFFSTSIRWPACASRTAGTFDAVHRLIKKADRGRQAAGPAARSYRRLARSRAVFPATAPPDPQRPGKGPRGPSIS